MIYLNPQEVEYFLTKFKFDLVILIQLRKFHWIGDGVDLEFIK